MTSSQLFSFILSKELSQIMPAALQTMDGTVLKLPRISASKERTDRPTETSTGRARCSEMPPAARFKQSERHG